MKDFSEIINIKRTEFDDMPEDFKIGVKEGYIDENGAPLKCYGCGHTDFKQVKEYRGEFGLEEYSLKCTQCGKIVGTWAYGHWV